MVIHPHHIAFPTKYTGSISALRAIVADEGTKGVWKGFGPSKIFSKLREFHRFAEPPTSYLGKVTFYGFLCSRREHLGSA